mmetsp:Transcript_18570/g.59267  ORF Transcript_18570/g.59267 Transcript_18570/m.59267 type:complete len:245 (-) Transcript_18570:990-1724(-)
MAWTRPAHRTRFDSAVGVSRSGDWAPFPAALPDSGVLAASGVFKAFFFFFFVAVELLVVLVTLVSVLVGVVTTVFTSRSSVTCPSLSVFWDTVTVLLTLPLFLALETVTVAFALSITTSPSSSSFFGVVAFFALFLAEALAGDLPPFTGVSLAGGEMASSASAGAACSAASSTRSAGDSLGLSCAFFVFFFFFFFLLFLAEALTASLAASASPSSPRWSKASLRLRFALLAGLAADCSSTSRSG